MTTTDPTKVHCVPVPKRFSVVVLLALGMLCIHVMRTNLGIAEVAIVDSYVALRRLARYSNTSALSTTPITSGARVLTGPKVGILNSALYVGLLLVHIPAGFLSMRFETRWIFVTSAFLSATVNNFIPIILDRVVSSQFDEAVVLFWVTTILRVVQGAFESSLMPACYALMGKWVPQVETSRFGSLVFAGIYGGAVIGYLIGGLFIAWDWRVIFWLTSGIVYCWCIGFAFTVHESPWVHPTIDEAEARLIHDGYRLTSSGKNVRIPWRDILTSLPVWSICICNFARNWAYYFLLTSQALYLKNFDFDHSTNGYLSTIPHICLVVTVVISGGLADKVREWSHNKWSNTEVRKLFNSVGFLGSAIFFMALAFAEHGAEAVAFLSVAVGLFGFSASGWQVNHLDLAPAFSSVLVGMSLTVGTVGGFISPLLIGFLVSPHSLAGWKLMFGLTAGLLCLAAVFFLIFGSGERQAWAVPQDDSIPLQATAPPPGTSQTMMKRSPSPKENGAFENDTGDNNNNNSTTSFTYGSTVNETAPILSSHNNIDGIPPPAGAPSSASD